MEAIGAIASIAQVAQLGTQLSLSLYNLAQTIGSASKDVQYVAKDISFFSAVLKDLSRAFERGKNVKLYRSDVYDTSLLIVRECRGVFSEIEEILKKSSKDGTTIDKGISLDRAGKFMWLFRKSRVQLLRGNLESLKSTILVELAVLNYAERVSSLTVADRANVDDLLALKSLVLANEAATQEFRELVHSTEDGLSSESTAFGPMATYGISNLAHGLFLASRKGAPPIPSQPVTAQVHSARTEAGLQMPLPIQLDRSAVKGTPAELASTAIPTSPRSLEHAKIWGVQDRVEHALRRVELAIWEQERIEENLLCHQNGRGHDQSQIVSIYLQRLNSRLIMLGLSPITARNIAFLFRERSSQLGVRTLTDQTFTPSVELHNVLQQLDIPWSQSKDGANTIRFKRWVPDLLEDILWKHTRRSIRAPSGIDALTPKSSSTAPVHLDASSHVVHDHVGGRPSPPLEQFTPPQIGTATSLSKPGEVLTGGNGAISNQALQPLKRVHTPKLQLQPSIPQQQQMLLARQAAQPPQLQQQLQHAAQQSPSHQQGMANQNLVEPDINLRSKRKRNVGASARSNFRISDQPRVPVLPQATFLRSRREVIHSFPKLSAPEDAQRQETLDAANKIGQTDNQALDDYQIQLMLHEQQNKKRLMMARQEQDNQTVRSQEDATSSKDVAARAKADPNRPDDLEVPQESNVPSRRDRTLNDEDAEIKSVRISGERRRRSSSRENAEKRIKAILANEELVNNPRSRKASHYFGLFKENTSSQDLKGENAIEDDSVKKNKPDLERNADLFDGDVKVDVNVEATAEMSSGNHARPLRDTSDRPPVLTNVPLSSEPKDDDHAIAWQTLLLPSEALSQAASYPSVAGRESENSNTPQGLKMKIGLGSDLQGYSDHYCRFVVDEKNRGKARSRQQDHEVPSQEQCYSRGLHSPQILDGQIQSSSHNVLQPSPLNPNARQQLSSTNHQLASDFPNYAHSSLSASSLRSNPASQESLLTTPAFSSISNERQDQIQQGEGERPRKKRAHSMIDGESVNIRLGVDKAENPRKRPAVACLTCRGKKIKCEPGKDKCTQCEKSDLDCRYHQASLGTSHALSSPLEPNSRLSSYQNGNFPQDHQRPYLPEGALLREETFEGNKDDASKVVDRLLALWTFVDTSAPVESVGSPGGLPQPDWHQ